MVLDDGTQLEGERVLSSAGWVETMRLCDDAQPADAARPGQLSFVETISVLDTQPRELGCDRRSCSSTTATSSTGRSRTSWSTCAAA